MLSALAQNSATAPAGNAQTQVPAPGSSQAQSPIGAPQQPSAWGMLLPFVLMFVVIYFLIIRPQQKRTKEHQALLDKVQHGDEVITNAGIFGTVRGVTDKVLTLEIADGVKIKLLKNQIASVTSKSSN